jgi:F0F1-type ATP synthase membrane subunit b/b'
VRTMAIGGDPQDLRDTARRMRGWADEVDADADAALSALKVQWRSLAADAYRDQLGDRRRDAAAVADDIREAARKVDELADALEDRQRTLTDLLQRAGKTVEDAQQAVAEGADDLIDGARDLAGKLTGGLL